MFVSSLAVRVEVDPTLAEVWTGRLGVIAPLARTRICRQPKSLDELRKAPNLASQDANIDLCERIDLESS